MTNDSPASGQEPAPESTVRSETTAQPAQPARQIPVRQPPERSTRPRTGPIVWGALILAFCGYVLQRTLTPGDIDATVWITGVTIGLGILLLAVGAAVLIRNRRSR